MAAFEAEDNGNRVYVQIPLWVDEEPERLRPIFAAYLLRWQLFGTDEIKIKESAYDYFKTGHEMLNDDDIYYIIKRFVEEGMIEGGTD